MLVVTTPDIPGWEIQRVCGEVLGVTVRSRAMLTQRPPGAQPMYGAELQALLKGLADSHHEVLARMLDAVRAKGGNAVVGMRFDTADLGDGWNELTAYGTAVVAIPVDDEAKATATALGYGLPGASPTPEAAPAQPYQQPAYQQPAYQQPEPAPGYQQPGYPQQQPQGYPQQPGYPQQQEPTPGYPQQQEPTPGYPQQPDPGQGYPQPGYPQQ